MRTPHLAVVTAVMMGSLFPIGAAENSSLPVAASLRQQAEGIAITTMANPEAVRYLQEADEKVILRGCGGIVPSHLPKVAAELSGIFGKLSLALPRTGEQQIGWGFFGPCPRYIPVASGVRKVYFNIAWLAQASEDEVWAAAAHEVAHLNLRHPVLRGIVLSGDVQASASEKARLIEGLETQADLAALGLLRAAGKKPEILPRLLKKELRKMRPLSNEEVAIQHRIAVLEKALKATLVAKGH